VAAKWPITPKATEAALNWDSSLKKKQALIHSCREGMGFVLKTSPSFGMAANRGGKTTSNTD
jgi:hypothetical protein